MKHVLLGSLGTLLIATAAAPALANEVAVKPATSSSNLVEVQPFNLVYLAYQGYFTDQGIPSNGAFTSAVKAKRVTAKDLVESAALHPVGMI